MSDNLLPLWEKVARNIALKISQLAPWCPYSVPSRFLADLQPTFALADQRRRAIILRLGGVVLFGRCGWPTAGKHAAFRTRHIHQITSECVQSNRRLTAHTYPDPLPLPG